VGVTAFINLDFGNAIPTDATAAGTLEFAGFEFNLST
jgi:hypothetical protein